MPGFRRGRVGLAAGLALLTTAASIAPVQAVPKRIILLRHGEKANAAELCSVGQERAIALRDTYLGRNAAMTPCSRGKPLRPF